MLGWIEWEERGRLRLEEKTVEGVPFAHLRAAPPRNFWQRRRLAQAMDAMAAAGVRWVAAEESVPPELLRQWRMQRAEPWQLRRTLLPRLLDWAEQVWGVALARETVLLSVDTADWAAWEAGLCLAGRARYVAVAARRGQRELEEALLRCRGLGQSCGRQAALEVCLAGVRQGSGAALYLGRGCTVRQKLRAETGTGVEWPETVLAALFQAGKLKTDEIHLKSVEFCP